MKDAFNALMILAVDGLMLDPTFGGFSFWEEPGTVVVTTETARYLIDEGYAMLHEDWMLCATDKGRELMSEYAVVA